MDDQLAVPQDAELRKLLSNFVCVRMVQMWGIDLSRFQFDYAMTWAVFFMNADGTIYGRYGTRSATRKQSARDISVDGLKRSMEATLALHKRFVDNRERVLAEIEGKQTQHAPAWARPEKIPRIARNKRLAVPFSEFAKNRNQRAHGVGCIHCHFVPNSEIMSLRELEKPIADRLIWPYPMPFAVGLHMDPRQRATVRRVVANSIAATAGIEAGDEIQRFAGQTILSTADIQWVLHNAGDGGRMSVSLTRGGESKDVVLELPQDWRRRLGDWRFTNPGVCMQIAGFQGRPAPRSGNRLAIRVFRVHRKRLADVDLKRNDIVVALDGDRTRRNLGQLTRFLLAKKPGSKLTVTRRRGDQGEKDVVLEVR